MVSKHTEYGVNTFVFEYSYRMKSLVLSILLNTFFIYPFTWDIRRCPTAKYLVYCHHKVLFDHTPITYFFTYLDGFHELRVVGPTFFDESVFKTFDMSPRKAKIITANTPIKLIRDPMPLVPLIHGLTSEPKNKHNNQLYYWRFWSK